MKKAGRKKIKFEQVRREPVNDNEMAGWALPRFSRILVPHAAGAAFDETVFETSRRADTRKQAAYMRKIEKEALAAETIRTGKPTASIVATREGARVVSPVVFPPPEGLPDWKDTLQSPFCFQHLLYNERDLDALQRSADSKTGGSTREISDKRRITDLVARWRALGGKRIVAAPVDDWRSRLDDLARDMPNFASVIAYLRGEFTLAEVAEQPIRLTPILLNGPPGVGKTRFARALAAIMDTGFGSVSMETAQTATQLTGSEEYWGNSRTGMLFNLLIEGEHSNPVMLIDEVDKARNNGSYDPLASLYSLLEPTSAATWFDLSVPLLKMDASQVIWILTANDKSRVPKPLLSRMRVFDIASLHAGQALEVVGQIFREQIASLMIDFDTTVPPAVLNAVAKTSPREMHRIARELIAKAVMQGHRHLLPEDLVGMDLGDVEVTPVTPVTEQYPPKLVKLRMYEAEVQVASDTSKASEASKSAEEVESDDAATGGRPKKMRLH